MRIKLIKRTYFIKLLFYDEDNVRSHEINFMEKYGGLYNLLEDLVTSKNKHR